MSQHIYLDQIVNSLRQDNAKLLGSLWLDNKRICTSGDTAKCLRSLGPRNIGTNVRLTWVTDEILFSLLFPRRSLIYSSGRGDRAWVKTASARLFFNEDGFEGELTLDETAEEFICFGNDLRVIPSELFRAAHDAQSAGAA